MNVWKTSRSRLRSLLARGGLARLDHPKEVRARRIAEALLAEGHLGIGDPLRVFLLPLSQLNSFLTIRDFGAALPVFGVCGGDWDMKAQPLERLPLYRMCEEHFNTGVPWEETEGFRELYMRGRKSGDRHLDPQYMQYMDAVYQTIKTQGYKTQSELELHRDFDGTRASPLNEVQICIGRDGRCMVKMGAHRTIFAKLLKLGAIPVRTRVRHANWQAIRDELCRSGEALHADVRNHLNHPELQDIRGRLRPMISS